MEPNNNVEYKYCIKVKVNTNVKANVINDFQSFFRRFTRKVDKTKSWYFICLDFFHSFYI